ncbi:MAG: hypothetical protein ACRC7N_13450 [Clostridium sp.]
MREDIILDILKEYKRLNKFREVFDASFFPHTKKDIDEAINEYLQNPKLNVTETKETKENSFYDISKIGKEISLINNEDKLYEYYKKSEMYKKENKDKMVKKLNSNELKYMYFIIFNKNLSKKYNKVRILDLINDYFRNKDRANSMKF